MLDPRIEELLEHTYIEQIEQGAVAPAFAPETVASAEALGLLSTNHPGGTLTDSGIVAARGVVRRHRLAECLLRDVLAVGDDMLDDDACRFEHLLRPGLEERVCTLLRHPTVCPHGLAIPAGDCCSRPVDSGGAAVHPLSDAVVGAEGTVAYLTTRDMKEIQKLMALGILPGSPIRLERKSPSFVFSVGYSQFTVDRELAGKIVVRWRCDEPAAASRPHRRRRFGLRFLRRQRA